MREEIRLSLVCPDFIKQVTDDIKQATDELEGLKDFSWTFFFTKRGRRKEFLNAYWCSEEALGAQTFFFTTAKGTYFLTNLSKTTKSFEQYNREELKKIVRSLREEFEFSYSFFLPEVTLHSGAAGPFTSCLRSISRLGEQAAKDKVLKLIDNYKHEKWFKNWLKKGKNDSFKDFRKRISRKCLFYLFKKKLDRFEEDEGKGLIKNEPFDRIQTLNRLYEPQSGLPIRACEKLDVMLKGIVEDFGK